MSFRPTKGGEIEREKRKNEKIRGTTREKKKEKKKGIKEKSNQYESEQETGR
jgi:hypothetical protein